MTHNMETEDFTSLVPRLEELARAEDELNSPAPVLASVAPYVGARAPAE